MSFVEKFIIVLFGFLIFPVVVVASSTDGTIDSTYKYAWGENIGWLNFGTTEGNVHITDSALTGYAWGENIGWISLNCSNDSSCGTVDYKVANDGKGNLSGYAWSENTGWINFNPTYGGVTINSSGEFLGYAWGENIGWIVFNCATTNSCGTVDYKVKTDWRPQSARPACNNATDDDGDGKIDYPNDPGCDSLTDTDETDPTAAPSGGGGMPIAWFNPSKAPEGGFKVLINNDEKYTDNLTVTLNLFGGSEAARMAISNNPEFSGLGSTGQIPYQSSYQWNLCQGRDSCPEGEYKVYVQFFASWGRSSGIVSDSIIYQIVSFTRDLFLGARGEDVRELQKFLNSKGFPLASSGPGSPGNETNFFGQLTKNGLAKFQAANNIFPALGYFGPLTRAFIARLKEPALPPILPKPSAGPTVQVFTRDLQLGSIGEDVRRLQQFLNSQGFVLVKTGPGSPGNETIKFGPLTRNAVIRFQEKYASEILAPWNLVKGTGYVGKTTRAKINKILGE